MEIVDVGLVLGFLGGSLCGGLWGWKCLRFVRSLIPSVVLISICAEATAVGVKVWVDSGFLSAP